MKQRKYMYTLTKLTNILLQNHLANYNQTWQRVSLCEWDFSVAKKGDDVLFSLNIMI